MHITSATSGNSVFGSGDRQPWGWGSDSGPMSPLLPLLWFSPLSLCLFFDEDNRHIGLGQTLNFNLMTSPKILFPVDVNLGDII